MTEIIDFCKAKKDADKARSDHFATVDIYMNADNSETWAQVDNVGMQDIDPSWHRFMAGQLRRLAWIADGMAAAEEGSETAPIATVSIFEDSKISVTWNDDKIITQEQIDWLRDQLIASVKQVDIQT